ncbi:TIR domain-containing protein [Pararobbsia alpina]|uniref:toll/interleukin-1 receptor domain-containing protein n=1 Tax=Pararobbsia alpina TaxID=621374 RepID=UPI0039A61D5B
MPSLFFSYSHVDEALRDQLEVHLAMLKRDGLIDTWHDRRISAGDTLDDSIDEQLEQADVILLLVSANFIASEYCYSREMSRAIERNVSGEARVIPVILRACDWHTAPFGKLLALPTDARPVTSWPNQDEAFADVARAIRKAVSRDAAPARTVNSPAQRVAIAAASRAEEYLPRSSNLRVRKEFSDLDRDTFLSDAFSFMARFFEGSLLALQERHPELTGRFERIDSRNFTASVYKGGKSVAECTISQGGYGRRHSEIRYSNQISTHLNSYSDVLTVGEDSQRLFLKPLGNIGRGTENQLSESGAAEHFWSALIERIQ